MRRIVLTKADVHSGYLVLVNAKFGYQEPLEGKRERLLPVGAEGCEEPVALRQSESYVLLKDRPAVLLQNLMEEICGWRRIAPVSGLRAVEEQARIWEDSLAENGKEFTEKFVAYPGHSEHQTGLAIDLGLRGEKIDFICPEFPYSGICQTFREKAVDYGFVERYPKGKESVTGIGHEPWHFRYVGMPHSRIMQDFGWVLEEYLLLLKEHKFGINHYVYEKNGQIAEVSYLEATGEKMQVEMEDGKPCFISGNNMDGYIITKWCKTSDEPPLDKGAHGFKGYTWRLL